MVNAIRNFFVNREWAVFVGVLTTLIINVEELLEALSVVATENNDWTPLGLVPLVAAVVTRARVWSSETVDEIKSKHGVL